MNLLESMREIFIGRQGIVTLVILLLLGGTLFAEYWKQARGIQDPWGPLAAVKKSER